MRTKICKYCEEEFTDIDYPTQFDRMVTCGSVECEGKRRRDSLKKRLLMKKRVT